MGEAYTIVIAIILLFPWSLVGVIVGGAAVARIRKAASARRRLDRSPGPEATPHGSPLAG